MLASAKSAGDGCGIGLKDVADVLQCLIGGFTSDAWNLVGEAGNEVFNGGHGCGHDELFCRVVGYGIDRVCCTVCWGKAVREPKGFRGSGDANAMSLLY